MTGPVQGGGGLRGFNWSTGSYPGTPLRVGMASALNGTEEAWLEHLPKRLSHVMAAVLRAVSRTAPPTN